MQCLYRHTQVGTVILGSLVIPAAILVSQALFRHVPSLVYVPTLLIVALVAILFPTLTTEVHPDRIRLYFGAGIIRRTIEMREVASANVVRNSWVSGWGIRLIPGGWMWNVSGLDAVELTLRNGKRFRIGTDEPKQLFEAIRPHTSSS